MTLDKYEKHEILSEIDVALDVISFILTESQNSHITHSALYLTAARLAAQLVGYQTVVREVEGSRPGRTNTQGLQN